jgi:hypothetical protein
LPRLAWRIYGWTLTTRLLFAASNSQPGSYFSGQAFGNASGLRSVNAIWQLYVILALRVNASRIGEPFFEFLGRLGRLAFYIPQLSINVVAKFPSVPTERAGLARLFCRPSEYRLWFRSALASTRLKLWRNLTEVFYRRFLAILYRVIFAKNNVFIDFWPFSKTTNAFPNVRMDVQRLN